MSQHDLNRSQIRAALQKVTGKGMPQYVLGHLDLMKKIQQGLAPHPRLRVTGAAYYGIGIPDCIREGASTAKGLTDSMWKKSA